MCVCVSLSVCGFVVGLALRPFRFAMNIHVVDDVM